MSKRNITIDNLSIRLKNIPRSRATALAKEITSELARIIGESDAEGVAGEKGIDHLAVNKILVRSSDDTQSIARRSASQIAEAISHTDNRRKSQGGA
jgi:hypothetical protein